MNLFYLLASNILTKMDYLKTDFLGFNLNFNSLTISLLSFVLSLFIVFATFSLGKKLFLLFYKSKEQTEYNYLLYIALGFIAISTGIAILGMISLLTPIVISVYLAVCFLFSFGFPFSFKKSLLELFINLKRDIIFLKKNKLVYICVLLFLLIGALNLINPEFREDQYHVDLPRIYLKAQTNMIMPKETLHVSAAPQLAESYYLIGIFLYSKETARSLHFMFYILVILTLINFAKIDKYKFAIFTPLLFVTAPVVIKETSSLYTDFEWIFCLLLSILVLIDNKIPNASKIKISGLLFGGMVASKLWTIVFYPVMIMFFAIKNKLSKNTLKFSFVFIIFSALSSFLWFLRSFMLTGNPVYPAFINQVNLNGTKETLNFFNYVGLNYALLDPKFYFNVFSPMFFIGIVLFLYNFKNNLRIIKQLDIFKFFFLILLLYISIHYPFGRYLLGLYIFFIFFASIGISKILLRFKNFYFIIYLFVFMIFSYYFISSFLVLPYTFGIADKNKYLSRILVRDNSSYFDYGKKFNKYIKQNDLVGVYNILGFYYADFNYVDINFIFDNQNKSFDLLEQKGVTKLFIRGGDMQWFCQQINLKDCTLDKYSLISDYLVYPNYYLYQIK